MNRATKIVAAVLVALALGLAVLAIILGTQSKPPEVVANAPVADPAPSYPVVIAEVELPVGQAIEAKQLKVVHLTIFPTGTKGDIDAFVGKKPVRAIPAGRPIYDTDLGGARPLAFAMADGERAIALTVEEIGGGGNSNNRISAGDYVDVFFSLTDQSNSSRSQVRLLLSRVRVLVYGVGITDNISAAQSGPVAKPAVLVVPLPDVPRLLLAMQHGRIVLAQRAPSDNAVADSNLFHQPGPALAARPGLTDAQRAALREPNNQAYAGMSLGGLASFSEETVPVTAPPVWAPPAMSPASPVPAAPRPAARTAPTRQVEIIRGTQTEVVPF